MYYTFEYYIDRGPLAFWQRYAKETWQTGPHTNSDEAWNSFQSTFNNNPLALGSAKIIKLTLNTLSGDAWK